MCQRCLDVSSGVPRTPLCQEASRSVLRCLEMSGGV